MAGLVGYIGQGLVTGPYVRTYVMYVVLIGVITSYVRQ